MPTYAIISVTFSGNRGAEAMLRSMIENITALNPESRFVILDAYPHADIYENDYENVEIVDARPKILMIRVFLEAFINKFFRKIPQAKLCNASQAFLKSDLVLDLSGVTFVDGRGLPLLIYNVQCVLIPKWFGIPVMKVSQAMGPFKRKLNRLAAKYCLNQVNVLCSRGTITSSHLRDLGNSSFHQTADAAFSLPEQPSLPGSIANKIQQIKAQDKRIVGICPSVVVEDYCHSIGMDYLVIINKFLEYVIDQRYHVVLFAHSIMEHSNKKKNNDRPLCNLIAKKFKGRAELAYFNDYLNTRELRTLISNCDFFIGSRFHSIISSLCVSVPFFLIGWSHKYLEVLNEFEIGSQAMDFKELSVKNLCARFDDLVQREQEIVEKITKHIDTVQKSSFRNASLAVDFVGGQHETK